MSRRSRVARSESLGERARAPLYRDPFEGTCLHARALSPADRVKSLQNCPRCGRIAAPEAVTAEAPCLLEGLSLHLMSLQSDKT